MERLIAGLRSKLIAALAGALTAVAWVTFGGAAYDRVEHIAYDSAVALAQPIAQESRVVIVDIDERSLAEVGPWPWPRATVAHLVDELTARQSVMLLGLDIVFPQAQPGDSKLLAAFERSPVVLSQTLDFAQPSENHVGALSGAVPVQPREQAPSASGWIGNDRGVLPANGAIGHISPLIDGDGRVRRLYPLACVDEVCSLSLALRMYAQLSAGLGDPPHARYEKSGRQLRLSLPSGGELKLPLDSERALMVPYRVGSGGFTVVSAADVLAGRTLPALQSAIALVGSSALGIGDRVATPIDRLTPGVEVHAQLLTALLDERLITPLPANSTRFLLVAAALLLSWLLWPRSSGTAAMAWLLASIAALGALLPWMLLQGGWWLPLSPLPLMAVVIVTADTLGDNFVLSGRLRSLGSQFSQFLPAPLVRRLLREPGVGPETELHTMTVLIADLRGFTAASEGKAPEQIAEFAQKCFELLSVEVSRYGGTIEKYTGDGLMALWGVPADEGSADDDAPLHVTAARAPHADYAARAVSAAIAMHRAVDEAADWFERHGYARPWLSIGLNTGPMSVGVFGGQSHMAWSAQGQAFNIASRIESLTRELGEHLLLGESTARLLAPDCVRRAGERMVKGVSAPVAVYGVITKNKALA